MKEIIILALPMLFINSANAQSAKLQFCDSLHYDLLTESREGNTGLTKKLYLNQVKGDLTINGIASKSPYQVYFILPIAIREQAPIWFDVQCPEMVDYRFIHLDKYNVFVAAQVNNAPDTIHLKWTSWVLEKENQYNDLPHPVPIPDFNELPDSVKPWLMPTGCVQWSDPFIKHIADSVRGTTTDLNILSNKIHNYVLTIPVGFPIYPWSFDAYYAMKWGNSCTGHAHAAAALFRESGIPCRVLMNSPTWVGSAFDQHWIIEYYIPQYGWVETDPTAGGNPNLHDYEYAITFACNPEDEFSMTYPNNMESYWFTSDTVFQHLYPDWGGAHTASQYCFAPHIPCYITDTIAKIDSVVFLADSVYNYFTTYQGIRLTNKQMNYFQAAQDFQSQALNYVKTGSIDSLPYYLNQALVNYRSIETQPLHPIFYDDFENGMNGWTHGGTKDQWELGVPTNVGPPQAYSGNNCWGTNLSGNYDNDVNCWLLSPSISLHNLSCAYLSVKIWNDVEDSLQGYNPKDKLWMEMSMDNGITFIPMTTCLGGVIDYKTGVPQVGGWSRLVLDLSQHIDTTVKIRFHFTSNHSVTRPGSYIDDFKVYGRDKSIDGIDKNLSESATIQCYPNPARNTVTVETSASLIAGMLSINDINGQPLIIRQITSPKTQIDISNLPGGVYIIRLTNDQNVQVGKFIKE